MQFRDLAKQYQVLKTDIDNAMLSVASGAHYIMGPQVKELEQHLAEYVGVKHCLTCANGTDALTLALKAFGIGPGDAVFVPDFTFFASAEVVALEGATPVFVDVDPQTFNMDAKSLDDAIRSVHDNMELRPKAVIAVDLFGLPADFTALRAITKREGMYLIEDGAQGFGGSVRIPKQEGDGYTVRRACSFGDIATTSFFPAKPLGCYGDGGAVFTDNDEWAALIESLRVHGKGSYKYDNVRIGMNSRLDTLQAAILQVKLRAFDNEVERVNEAAAHYTRLLENHVVTPVIPEGFRSSWAQYTIRLNSEEQRNSIQQALKEAGIPSMVYYPKTMHQQTAFAQTAQPTDCDSYVARRLCATVLSLPMHPYIETSEIENICSTLIATL